MTMRIDKKFPLNMSMSDDMLAVSNPKIVDIEWQTLYSLASKNLNKLMQPYFKITQMDKNLNISVTLVTIRRSHNYFQPRRQTSPS
jgi:hypothetical protein